MPSQAEMRARLAQRQPARQPWDFLSRWRCLPVTDGWQIRSEAGAVAPEPHTFPDNRAAQRRADELNREEQYRMIGRRP